MAFLRRCPLTVAAGLLACLSASPAQTDDGLRIFGFFQNSFMHQSDYANQFESQPTQNSFSLQQHNLFFQKDLDRRWRAFVNYEFLNSFSTARRWGSANIEEAWVRYRANARFSLKLGLLIPEFNNLNAIKNRTPVLPYIIRPLVYETSFSEFIATEEYLPARAFAQAYGFVPLADAKLDYAVFLGNGPDINDDPDVGQTGVDTTDSFLIGGRLGVRYRELKAGLSGSRDHLNVGVIQVAPGETIDLRQLTRRRLGADLSYLWQDLSFEAEALSVDYDDDVPGFSADKSFYYATLGYRASERLYLYGSYYVTREDFVDVIEDLDPDRAYAGDSRVEVPTVGFSYQLRDSIVLKGQFAPVDIEAHVRRSVAEGRAEFSATTPPVTNAIELNHLSTSISVVF
jgi:hypothetical protein